MGWPPLPRAYPRSPPPPTCLPVNDLLLTIGVITLAIGAAMIFTVWRIRRIQYPPELRWPSDRDRDRRRRKRRSEDKK